MIPFPDKKYQIIYADPPWQYQNYNYAKTKKGIKAKRGIVKEYFVMSINDIKSMPINNLTDTNCILFLWVTFPLLQEGLDTIKAWGFEYKTLGFNWIKKNKKANSWFWGMGNWTRSNPELCLIGIRGNPKRINAGVHSLIDTPIQKHSQKPNEARKRIRSLLGDLPRIELFARETFPGWDCWGNEV